MRLFLFDDARGCFGPLTDLRASFELRTGAGLTRWRIEHALGAAPTGLMVPPKLAGVVGQRYALPVNEPLTSAEADAVLLVNGRWPGVVESEAVRRLEAGSMLVQADGQLVAACLSPADAQVLVDARYDPAALPATHANRIEQNLLLERPWDILDQLEASLDKDAAYIDLPAWRGRESHIMLRHGYAFKAARDAVLHPGIAVDTTRGPVYIGEGAVVHSMVTLEGPCYIGSGSTIMPHTSIRANTIIGPVCKVAGEISFCIIHGYSNKAHAGFLGHSLVGQWVNLGADTTVSNLKNTYGTVRMQLTQTRPGEDSGRQFLGPLIGDYVRTAIGTRLTTGACIGTGAMLAMSSFSPRFVAPFSFCTDQRTEPADPPRFFATVEAMLARRQVVLGEAERARIEALMSEAIEGGQV